MIRRPFDQPDLRINRQPRDFGDRRRVDLHHVESKARDERERLEREKEKLRIERERLEREKAELLRMERDRARQEREKIEREREEIAVRRAQAQLARPIEDMSRIRPSSTISAKRPYESRESEPYWDDRKRQPGMLSQAIAISRNFDAPTGSEFDARQSFVDSRAEPYGKRKFDMNTGSARGSDFERRDSRHGGHERDDRRGFVSGGGYNKEARRSSRDRERNDRRQGGRDEWKPTERRDSRYNDNKEALSSTIGFQGTNNRFGGDRMDWSVKDRNQSSPGMNNVAYGALDSRNPRGPGLNPALMAGSSAGLSTMFTGPPMGGIMSHANIPANSGLAAFDTRNLHGVNRRY
jgi:hypothetical protein